MQPVVEITCPQMERCDEILIIIALSIIMIQFRNLIEKSLLMGYYRFYKENYLSLRYEWMIHFVQSIQVAEVKIDKYTPRDWSMYNEGNDSGYTDRYNQVLLEGPENGWDEAKEYYQKIFERELREANQILKEEGANTEYSEEIAEQSEESEVNDQWSSYGQNRDSKQTESGGWFED